MSLSSRKSPILSSLTARRKHHIHTVPAVKDDAVQTTSEQRERPFGELKFDVDTTALKPAYKSIFSL